MRFFTLLGHLDYRDLLQVDGAFSTAHINYGKSLKFNKIDGKAIAVESRKESLSSKNHIEDVLSCLNLFNGTEQNLDNNDREELWKNYWLEYVNAFDKLVKMLPESVATIFIGRHAIELGLKFILLQATGKIHRTHDLGILSQELFSELSITQNYMDYIDSFCENYCRYIEGDNVEYFRYPQYKNSFFAGNQLDSKWLFYNFSLILLKLIHFANLDLELQDNRE